MAANPIDVYRRQIERELQVGNTTEPSHYPALKTLIESLADGVTTTVNPKRVECGAPAFVISRKAAHGPGNTWAHRSQGRGQGPGRNRAVRTDEAVSSRLGESCFD